MLSIQPARQSFDPTLLNNAGINRQAIFNLDALPAEITASLPLEDSGYRQLILLGHGGKALWQAVQQSSLTAEHPIDEFTIQAVQDWFARCLPQHRYSLLYPGTQPLHLQRLGELAGWHHPSPFMVGIDHTWGSWFAYRAVALADTAFAAGQPLTAEQQTESPCHTCLDRPCISSCPATALSSDGLVLEKCLDYRVQDASSCQTTCLARCACPVGSEHRYEADQMRHVYERSLRCILALR